ncbi:DUF1232 domain-containing protein [Halorhodospira neutriphila]
MARRVTGRAAAERLRADAERVRPEDLGTVVHRADEIRGKVAGRGPLGRFIKDVRLMLALVRDYWRGDYRQVPWWAIAAVAAALLYILNPVDLIPDFIPVVGHIDDATVVAACLLLVEQQLAEYEAWREAAAVGDDGAEQ